jgi:uncharacterized protein YdiU (UPF0061 family)
MALLSTIEPPRLCIGPLAASYARLPERFFARLAPVPVAQPRLIQVNRPLAEELGLDLGSLNSDALAALFAGNVIPAGAEPIAMAYAGHQFGHFVPQLGDGRAILLAEAQDAAGQRRDIQLKGSGRTPFSRGGDGRAALGPVLREYLLSEAMHALGIPTTRSLAAVTTGETVVRDGLIPGAVLTRVASSHVRVGTFQYFAAREDGGALRELADYVIDRHYPGARATGEPYLALLRNVAERQALLVARWLQVGFIHGVMNTDNMAVAGETIDFGPCAFMDEYDPATVYSSIDHAGRYAYANQPLAAQWNLARFAETLLPLLDAEPQRAVERATEVIMAFPARHASHWLALMRRKLGLLGEQAGDLQLIQSLLELMHANRVDYTNTFRALNAAAADADAVTRVRALFGDGAAFDAWAMAWRSRLDSENQSSALRARSMCEANPAYIPRNHRVEQVIRAAVDRADFAPFRALLQVLERPFDERPELASYALPPRPGERVLQTFCGT